MILIFIFILGLVMGSFYTVVGLRLPEGKSILKPGSYCPNCNKGLKWYELIPILSYFLQKFKCNQCRNKIPIYYPLVELFTGSLFALCFYLFGFSYEFYAGIIISSVLIIIFVSDFKYMIILDSPLVIGTLLILGLKFYYFGLTPMLDAVASGILLFIFLFILKICADKIYKREALGGGDVKLAVFTGVVLGIKLGLVSMIIASFMALPYALLTINRKDAKEIPFGPFLVIALLLVFLRMDGIEELITNLFTI